MKKIIAIFLAAVMSFAVPAFAVVNCESLEFYEDCEDYEQSEQPEPPKLYDWEIALNRTLERIVTSVPSPNFGVVGGEWSILALARSGFDVPDGYFEGYLSRVGARLESLAQIEDPNSVTPGRIYNSETGRWEVRLSNAQTTENARLIVALTSLGIDASNFTTQSGYVFDLVSRLGNRHNATTNEMWGERQGINGPIWSLIALYSHGWENPYEISDREWVGGTTEENPITLDERVDWVLDRQLADGGWALSGAVSDPDMTGMALMALAPHIERADVAEAIDAAIEWLSDSQTETGGWASLGTYNVQSVAQVIAALTTLGIDPSGDERFIANGGGTAITSLLSFQDAETGGFIHGGGVNIMATDQAAYALVAYWRLRNEMNSLHDMSDAFDGDGEIIIEVDRTALEDVIEVAEKRVQSDYTVASWTVMQTYLEAAIEVLDDENAVQAELDEARDNLSEAIAALVPVSTGGSGPGTGTQPTARRAFISVRDPNARAGQTSVFFAGQYFDINPGETVYSLLRRTGLNISSRGHAAWAGMYIDAINNWGEFDDGPLSGWMYRVNGVFPQYSSSTRVLQDGDRVEWLFTRDLGVDIGGSNFGNNQNQNDQNQGTGNQSSGTGTQAASPDEDDDDECDVGDGVPNVPHGEENIREIEWENPFSDVAEDNWFYDYVRFAYTANLMTGVGNGEFSPNTNLSRAMIITILARVAEVDTSVGETWYFAAVEWGMSAGITDGSNLQDNVTREQLATMLYRFAQYVGASISRPPTGHNPSDIDDVSDWAQSAMLWANANGIITGRTITTLAPQGFATRAEAAAILQRFVERKL